MTSVRQRSSAPNMEAPRRGFGENTSGFGLSMICADDRAKQIQLCATFVDEAHGSQDSVDEAKSSEAIDVNRRQSNTLQQQFLIVHVQSPSHEVRAYQSTSCADSKNKNVRDHQIRFCAASCLVSGTTTPQIVGAQA